MSRYYDDGRRFCKTCRIYRRGNQLNGIWCQVCGCKTRGVPRNSQSRKRLALETGKAGKESRIIEAPTIKKYGW